MSRLRAHTSDRRSAAGRPLACDPTHLALQIQRPTKRIARHSRLRERKQSRLRGQRARASVSGSSPLRSSASERSRRSLSRNALVASPARFDRTGGSVLARIEQAPAPSSAERAGLSERPLTPMGAAGGLVAQVAKLRAEPGADGKTCVCVSASIAPSAGRRRLPLSESGRSCELKQGRDRDRSATGAVARSALIS